MDQEFEDFMTDGFESVVPGFGGWTVKPFPVPIIPDSVLRCVKILRALNTAREDRKLQQEAADKLEQLVNALGENAHPLIILFAALFKYGLQEVQDRVQELDDLIDGLMRSGFAEGCF
ncbi:MAG: hypothetical protein GQ535_17485 [Rhodobacteraceae bacterium]|nr:hypothetical protein [Paracoccaceae bacterium]